GIRFVTRTSQTFEQMVFPTLTSSSSVSVPQNTVQASINIAWDLSANDFGLKVYDASNTLLGESNYLNLPGLTGRREKVVFRNPLAGNFRAAVRHSSYVGTSQTVFGAVEVTQVEYPTMTDLDSLSPELAAEAEKSLLMNVMMPEGRKFRPASSVTRAEFADALVRGGFVPQYIASAAMFSDVRDIYSRGVVESIQANPTGALVIDAASGGRYYPNNSATKLIAAIAYVRATQLDSLASSTPLPTGMTDAASIPAQWRGYVAVALQHGFIRLDGSAFNASRSITRIELAQAVNAMIGQ
ncbi:MAG: S-layer homology domain-containing protein, partial [Acidobacteriota bacterium]